MKENNKKYNILKIILFLIVFELLLLFILFIIKQVNNFNLFSQIHKANYTFSSSHDKYLYIYDNFSEGAYQKDERHIYVKGNKAKEYSPISNSTFYHDFETNIEFFVNENNKTAMTTKSQATNLTHFSLPYYFQEDISEQSLKERLKRFFMIEDISVEIIYNISCYKIITKDFSGTDTYWYSTETLLPIKYLSSHNDITYKLTTCPLSEEELTFDSTGYEIIELKEKNN